MCVYVLYNYNVKSSSVTSLYLLGNYSRTYEPSLSWFMRSNIQKAKLQSDQPGSTIGAFRHCTLPRAHILTSQLLLFFLLFSFFILFTTAAANHISLIFPVWSTHVSPRQNSPTLVISRNELWL